MREFKHKGGSLRRLPLGGRLLYSAFLFMITLGLGTALALYYDKLGLGLDTASAYYLGNEGDLQAAEMLFAKTPRELLEVSHFHLFTMPVVLLVIAHLFILTRGGAWRGWVVAAALTATLLHIAGPWLVWGLGWGWVMPTSGLGLLLTYLCMILWTGVDLWRP